MMIEQRRLRCIRREQGDDIRRAQTGFGLHGEHEPEQCSK